METQRLEQLAAASSCSSAATSQPPLTLASRSRPILFPAQHRTSLIFLLIVLLFCAYLRFINLGWGLAGKYKAGTHPDEPIVVGVNSSLPSNRFDTDMARAPLPAGLQWARYNFSSYFYLSYLWHLLATRGLHSTAHAVLIYRQLSALLGVLVCILIYGCARMFLDRPFAILAALFTGVLPILVQDSHYARAEAFVTAGAVAVLWLAAALASAPTLRRCFWSGVLVGVLLACKVSLALLLFLPALSIAAFYWPERHSRIRLAGKSLGLLCAGTLAGFLAGVPYIVIHSRVWWQGWQHLRRQYANPFPPYGADPPGYCFGFIAHYILSTFGAALLLAAGLGLVRLAGRKQYLLLSLLLAPLALYYLVFGFQLAFFERNISHVVPWLALLAAIGCRELWDRLKTATASPQLRAAALSLAVVLILWVPLRLSWRIAVIVFSGHTYDSVEKYDALIRGVYPRLPVLNDALWAAGVLEHIHQYSIANPAGFILKLGDGGDELSRHQRFVAEHLFPLKLLAVEPGHFADLPVCTLQIYHSQTYTWYLVRP